MIVKNEAHCIEQCLTSVKPFIDYWVISDTGSTDNTEKVVRKSLEGIPGEYHHHAWSDFATNRNLSLNLSKPHADYILIIDADDYLTVNNSHAFDDLKAKAYNLQFQHGSIQYNRVQLIRSDIPSKYVGVVHEYLDLGNIDTQLLSGCNIVFGGSGSRSRDPLKYLHDAEVLEKALQTEPDNARYVFYCAQSYRDAGELEKAINYYVKRSQMGGWIEEIYVSLLEAGKLLERTKADPKFVELSYLHAHNIYPQRAEALFYLSWFCRRNNEFDKAYFYSKIGMTITQPVTGLFIESACYDWRMKDEAAISSYYIGNRMEAAQLNKELLKNYDLSPEDKARVIANLDFCKSI